MLGVLTVYGHVTLTSAAAVIVAALMGFKPLLHGWLKKLEQQELNATLQLLLISVVMLPILPNQGCTATGRRSILTISMVDGRVDCGDFLSGLFC